MNNKALVLAAVMAVLAVFFVQSYVESVEEEAMRRLGTRVLVVRASEDINENETLTEKHLEMSNVPKEFVEPSAVFIPPSNSKKQEEEIEKSLKSLVGSVAIIPIRKGEQITYSKITEPGMRTGLAPQVSPGKRAVAVPVNDTSAVSRLVKPGDRVDIIAVLDPTGRKTEKVTMTILQDILILAVGKNVSNNVARIVEMQGNRQKIKNLNDDTNFGSVTVEVDPYQAQVIATALANNDGGLSLSLRNNDDPDRTAVPAVKLEDLLLRAPASKR